MRNNKGITLIALIITIIVMLILAAVAVNLSTGNNGIIKKAGEASKAYTDAEVEEKVELALLKNLFDENGKYIGNELSDEQVKKIVNTALGNVEFMQDVVDSNNSSSNSGNIYIYAFTYNSKTYNITSNWQVNVNIGNAENTTPTEDAVTEEVLDISGTYTSGPYTEEYGNYIAFIFSEEMENQFIFKYHDDDGIKQEVCNYIIEDDLIKVTLDVNGEITEYYNFKFIPIYDENNCIVNKILINVEENKIMTSNGTVGLIRWNYPATRHFKYNEESKTLVINDDGTMCFPNDTLDQKFYYYIDGTELDIKNHIYPNLYTRIGHFIIIDEIGDLVSDDSSIVWDSVIE